MPTRNDKEYLSVSVLSKYDENPDNIGAHTCELKYINGAKLKAFGLGYSCDVLKAGISGTKGANCVFTNTIERLYLDHAATWELITPTK